MRVVVDASVLAKWFLPEPHADAARRLTTGQYEVLVPDLVFAELGTILRKHIAAGKMSDPEAHAVMHALARTPLQIHRTWSLGLAALDVERRLRRAMYQNIHLALAMREGAVLVTADKRFYKAARSCALGAHVCWIDDVH